MKTDKFAIGEVVHSNDPIDMGVHIEIIELLEDQGLRVKLTIVPPFWQQNGFNVGEEHNLKHYVLFDINVWFFDDKSLPEFGLSVNSFGEKTFRYVGI